MTTDERRLIGRTWGGSARRLPAILRRGWIAPALVALAALALYAAGGAPTVLTGDQAEHQFTAWVVGVPHATGYPLFTMLNALAAHLLPIGDVARRVTLMTALWSALAVAGAFVLGRKLGGGALAGAVAAATLATSNEFWSLSLIAEVYTLQALFILAIWGLLLRWWEQRQPAALYGAAFVAGLAATHHGSFVPIVAPALLLTVALPLWLGADDRVRAVRQSLAALGCGLLGLTPWLYLAAQYALFRPFDYYRGQGFPYHSYWGNPASWRDVANLALGAGFRGEVFTHGWAELPQRTLHFLGALRGEFWWIGLALGAAGCWALLLRSRRVAGFSLLVFVSAALFGMNVGANIPKAHVYFLPAYVIWSVWAGIGAGRLAERAAALAPERWRGPLAHGALLALLAPALLLGAHRYGRMDRSGERWPRQMAEQVLATVAPNAVILCRWELCMPIRYVQFVERRRLDVQLDQTEPEAGSDWADRADLYAGAHPVYALQRTPELAARYRLEPALPRYDLWRALRGAAGGAP